MPKEKLACDVCWETEAPLSIFDSGIMCEQCHDKHEVDKELSQLQLITEQLEQLEVEALENKLWKE